MCLGYPALLEKINDFDAVVDVAGTKRDISVMFLGDTVQVGDWVMVHAGFAMAKMDAEEAKATLKDLMETTGESE